MFVLANNNTTLSILFCGSILSKLIIFLIAFIKYLNWELRNPYLNINSYKIMGYIKII